jgi:hypothetical protein
MRRRDSDVCANCLFFQLAFWVTRKHETGFRRAYLDRDGNEISEVEYKTAREQYRREMAEHNQAMNAFWELPPDVRWSGKVKQPVAPEQPVETSRSYPYTVPVIDPVAVGHCRRRPPVRNFKTERVEYPRTDERQWCGEHEFSLDAEMARKNRAWEWLS